MKLLKKLVAQLKSYLSQGKAKRTIEPGTYISKRFPFIWLCLILVIGLSPQLSAKDLLAIQLEGPSLPEYLELAKTSFYTLPSATVQYSSYPLIFRLPNLEPEQVRTIQVTLESQFHNQSGPPSPEIKLEWKQGTWIWEGRENEGPAPGFQFTAELPLLSPPGRYEADLVITFCGQDRVLERFPVRLGIDVPKWAVCLNPPGRLNMVKKSLGGPNRHYLESEELNLLIAANTNWSLWLESDLFRTPKLVARGGNSAHTPSGYIKAEYVIREPWDARRTRVDQGEKAVEIILRY